jgi:hypothetical protein
MAAKQLQLPMNVFSRSDIGRLQNELGAVDNFLTQAAIRQPGTPMQLPKSSHLFDELVATNKFNMLQATDRKELGTFLQEVIDKAPVLSISLQADPSALFLQKLCIWLRQNIHPQLLIQVGLRPTIGAGCVIRSTNKYFDFSLRQHFANKKSLLIKRLQIPPAVSAAQPAVEQKVT